jgi:hypothetical protein
VKRGYFIDPATVKTRAPEASGPLGTSAPDAPIVICDTQASCALAIYFNIANDEYNERFAENYYEACRGGRSEGAEYTINTGFYVTGKVLPALMKIGRVDVAYEMLEQTEYAS